MEGAKVSKLEGAQVKIPPARAAAAQEKGLEI